MKLNSGALVLTIITAFCLVLLAASGQNSELSCGDSVNGD